MSKKKSLWTVTWDTTGTSSTVRAHTVRHFDGVLEFVTKDGELLGVYAPGAWVSVERVQVKP